MSASLTAVNFAVPGDSTIRTLVIAGDAAYPLGGYTFTPQQLGFASHIRRVISCEAANMASALYVPVMTLALVGPVGQQVATGLQFQLENYTVATEVSNGTNVSAASFVLTVMGK